MKYLFRGGTVVSGRGTRRADILVEGEKIVEVGRNITRKADQIIDVTGMLLMPGFIDAHTHFDLDVCNTTTADNFTTGSRAALRGGTTTVVDFACPNKGESLHHGLELWHRKADGRTCCDYGFHMTIDDWNPQIEAEIDDMYAAGISSFKMYMTYPAMMIGDNAMYHALKKLKEKGGICGVHCENSGVIDHIRNRFFIKIEISAFPAIQDDRQFLISMGQCIVTRPVVQVSRYLSLTGRTICPDHFRSLQRFTRFQIISRGKIIHPAHDVQQTAFVNLKGRQIVTRPGQGAGIHFAPVFIGRAIQGKQERRVFRLGSTYPLLGFHPFYTRCQLFFYQLHFGSPGSVEMGQIIRICV